MSMLIQKLHQTKKKSRTNQVDLQDREWKQTQHPSDPNEDEDPSSSDDARRIASGRGKPIDRITEK